MRFPHVDKIEGLVEQTKANITEISVTDARKLNSTEIVFVDVREPPEWKRGVVESALKIPRGVFEWECSNEERLENKSIPIVVYCKSGGRSALAAQSLQRLDFTKQILWPWSVDQ